LTTAVVPDRKSLTSSVDHADDDEDEAETDVTTDETSSRPTDLSRTWK
jgi:hypothetical protein